MKKQENKVEGFKGFENLTIEQKIAMQKALQNDIKKSKGQTAKEKERAKIKEQKELEREKLNAEKICAKESYRGLFNIFNEVKKIPTFKTLRIGKFRAVQILGSMNFNQFVNQLKKGVYTFEEIYSHAKKYHFANDGDKVLISERGEIINGLLMDVKNEVLTPNQAVEKFVELYGLPYRTDKDGVKIPTINRSCANVLKAIDSPVYTLMNCAELFPEVIEETEAEKIEA